MKNKNLKNVYCIKCGAKNNDSDEFCSDCGEKLVRIVKKHTKEYEETTKVYKDRFKISWAILGILIFIILIWGALFIRNHLFIDDPKDTVNSFFSLVNEREFDQALEIVDPDEKERIGKRLEFYKLIDGLNFRDIEMKTIDGDAKKATIETSGKVETNFFGTKNTQDFSQKIDLERIGGKWYIEEAPY